LNAEAECPDSKDILDEGLKYVVFVSNKMKLIPVENFRG
jgi:hypothetical protein